MSDQDQYLVEKFRASLERLAQPARPEEQLENTLRIVLDRWVQAQLFDPTAAKYFVCEAKDDPGDPQSQGLRSGGVLRNSSEFFIEPDRSGVAPVSHRSLLLPTHTNEVHLHPSRASLRELEVHISLAEPYEEFVAQEAGEIDLYCSARSLEDLQLFRVLTRSRWPQSWALPRDSREFWPRVGTREIWSPSNPALPIGPTQILNAVRSPLEERFLRIPLRGLETHVTSTDPSSLVIPVRLPFEVSAELLAKSLAGKLWVNHVLFSTRIFGVTTLQSYMHSEGVSDAPTRITFDVDGLRSGDEVLILECEDQRSGAIAVDERWAVACDPDRTFKICSVEANRLELSFATPPGKNVRLSYMTQSRLPDDPDLLTDGTLINGTRELLVKGHPASCVSSCPEGRGDAVALLLSSGHGRLCPRRLVTRNEVVEALLRLLPAEVHDLIEPSQQEDLVASIGVFTVVMAGPADASSQFGFPTTVIVLPRADTTQEEGFEHELERVARELEFFCTIGTRLLIRWDRQRGTE